MTVQNNMKLYCKNCNKDVTDECISPMDSSELPNGMVWMSACPYCKSLKDLEWRT